MSNSMARQYISTNTNASQHASLLLQPTAARDNNDGSAPAGVSITLSTHTHIGHMTLGVQGVKDSQTAAKRKT